MDSDELISQLCLTLPATDDEISIENWLVVRMFSTYKSMELECLFDPNDDTQIYDVKYDEAECFRRKLISRFQSQTVTSTYETEEISSQIVFLDECTNSFYQSEIAFCRKFRGVKLETFKKFHQFHHETLSKFVTKVNK